MSLVNGISAMRAIRHLFAVDIPLRVPVCRSWRRHHVRQQRPGLLSLRQGGRAVPSSQANARHFDYGPGWAHASLHQGPSRQVLDCTFGG